MQRQPEDVGKGASLRKQMIGEPEAHLPTGATADAFALFREEEVKHIWATYWQRDGLDTRSRMLCVLSLLVSLGYEEDLKTYITGALRNKVLGKVEIREAIMQCAGYVGYPKTLAARRAAAQAFAEYQESQP